MGVVYLLLFLKFLLCDELSFCFLKVCSRVVINKCLDNGHHGLRDDENNLDIRIYFCHSES